MLITQMIKIAFLDDELDHLPFRIEHKRIHKDMKGALELKNPSVQDGAWAVVAQDGAVEILGRIEKPTSAVLTLTDTTLEPFIREAKRKESE